MSKHVNNSQSSCTVEQKQTDGGNFNRLEVLRSALVKKARQEQKMSVQEYLNIVFPKTAA